jgi:hypothetical protein
MYKAILILMILTVTILVSGCHNGKLGFPVSRQTPIRPRVETPSRAEQIKRANERLRKAGVSRPWRYTKHQLNRAK